MPIMDSVGEVVAGGVEGKCFFIVLKPTNIAIAKGHTWDLLWEPKGLSKPFV